MDRSSKLLLRKIIIDFVCLLVVALTVLVLFLVGKPYKRGFFCNDESLYHPYHSSTVTSAMLYVTGLFLPICAMIIGEYLHARYNPEESSRVLLGYTIPAWLWMAYKKVGVFGFGAVSTVLTTDIAKYTIGRLRPHFMQLCVPSVDCSLPENQHRYIENFTCTASNVTAKLLKELRLSFPSGHSSFSAYTMVYLAMYLQVRVTWKGSKLLKHFLQLMCLFMAWFTAMSRISDYKHHWSDVFAGSILGVVIAVTVANAISDLFAERRRSPLQHEKRRAVDYEADTGTQDETSGFRSNGQTYGGTDNNRFEEHSIESAL